MHSANLNTIKKIAMKYNNDIEYLKKVSICLLIALFALINMAIGQVQFSGGIKMTTAKIEYKKWHIPGIGNLVATAIDLTQVDSATMTTIKKGGARVSPFFECGFINDAHSIVLQASGGKYTFAPDMSIRGELNPFRAIGEEYTSSELANELINALCLRLQAGNDFSYPVDIGRGHYYGFGVGFSYTHENINASVLFNSLNNADHTGIELQLKYIIQ